MIQFKTNLEASELTELIKIYYQKKFDKTPFKKKFLRAIKNKKGEILLTYRSFVTSIYYGYLFDGIAFKTLHNGSARYYPDDYEKILSFSF